jgi:CubicO group peptidase (beta-lactamase class C family)
MRAFGILVLLTQAAHAQSALRNSIDTYVTHEMQARRIPGAAVAVVEHGAITFQGAYGVANLETETPVRANSIFQLASLTKQFTAAAIMMLVEQGKVRLDAPIATYIDKAPAAWSAVTVRHLLTHTSGITPGAIVRIDGTPLLDISAARALEFVSKPPLMFQPGERGFYSDTGFFLLGLIIQKASGEPYRDFIQHHVFDALHMTSSTILDKWKIVRNAVPVYTMHEGQIAHWRRDWQYEVNAFAGVCSTVEDLSRWIGAFRNQTLLKKTSIDQMWTPARLNNGEDALVTGDAYGFGWMLSDYRGHRVVQHAGASGTFLLHFPDDDLSVIVLTNLDGPSGSRPAFLARGIAGYVKNTLRPPETLDPPSDPDPDITRALRALLSDLGNGKESPRLTPEHQVFFKRLPPEERDDVMDLFKSVGPLVFVASDVPPHGVRRLSEPVSRICYYRGDAGGKTLFFTFWLTGEGKVAYLSFYPL